MILPNELIVDNFAGGGGASTGIEAALGRPVDIAINHDSDAIDMHTNNHPTTRHFCEDVWHVDPVKACAGKPVGLAWFSPDCKHFSKAKGTKPVEKTIRGLAWVAIRWAASVPVRIMMLENVEEFMTWGPLVKDDKGRDVPCPDRRGETFQAFCLVLTTGLPASHPAWPDIRECLGEDFAHYDKLERGLGYKLEHRVLRACDFGVPTTRQRFYLVARNDGEPIYWPVPTHGERDWLNVQAKHLAPFKTAADIIDWSVPVKSIFGRERPLAEKTMERIAKGIKRYVLDADQPFIAPTGIPFITEHANASNQRNMPADEPLRTICAQVKGGHFALVTAFIAKHYTGVVGDSIKNPLPTITTKDHNAVVTSHLVKFRGNEYGLPVTKPVPTITAGGGHIGEVRAFLLKYYGTAVGSSLNEPLDTVTTKDRFGLVTIHGEDYQIVDIGMRMLEPHELFAAMGFPADYAISHKQDGAKRSKAAQVARCGNAVCPGVAQAIIESNIGRENRERFVA